MKARPILSALLLLAWAQVSGAQLDQTDRIEILRTMIADNAASRIVMPLGGDGVRLSESGVIDDTELQEELRKNGRAISPGQVVEITAIAFGGETIEVELDGGGKNERSILERIQFGIGARTTPVREADAPPAKGSKVVLRFDERTPQNMTVDQLRALLAPVLDFNKQNFMDSGIESLPTEFQEAVLEKEARIGMDRSTVTKARGRPNGRSWETNEEGIDQEIWIYEKTGFGADFLTFEDGVLVKIVER